MYQLRHLRRAEVLLLPLLSRSLRAKEKRPLRQEAVCYQLLSNPMSKKDYQRIARAFRIWKPGDEPGQQLWLAIVYQIATELKEDNPRFCRETFVRACEG